MQAFDAARSRSFPCDIRHPTQAVDCRNADVHSVWRCDWRRLRRTLRHDPLIAAGYERQFGSGIARPGWVRCASGQFVSGGR